MRIAPRERPVAAPPMANAWLGFHVSGAALDALARTVDHSAPKPAKPAGRGFISAATRDHPGPVSSRRVSCPSPATCRHAAGLNAGAEMVRDSCPHQPKRVAALAAEPVRSKSRPPRFPTGPRVRNDRRAPSPQVLRGSALRSCRPRFSGEFGPVARGRARPVPRTGCRGSPPLPPRAGSGRPTRAPG